MTAVVPRKVPQRNAAALEAIFTGPGRPYAIVDAARTRRVLRLVKDCGERAAILYEGRIAPEIAEVAPYLIPAERGSGVAEDVAAAGWGDAWGVFCNTRATPDELRRHLRKFLTVRTETGKKLLFRFYDPRVLRAYLPTCTPAELQAFFGPVERFVCEADDARFALVHRREGEQLKIEEVPAEDGAC